ncbi:MAG TPA: ATP-binding protein [Steroidobacteraceae bacterium]|nr:ATP-binding protein [Steroidobacteraceae bacterium]
MSSIRTRLLLALLGLVAVISLLAGVLTYRRVLAETSALFDYQLRQMALSLENQVPLAPRLELPPTGTDFVVEIWDLFGRVEYLSRPGLPTIDRPYVGYANVTLQRQRWRVYGLQSFDGVIQVAQPLRVRAALARAAALRVVIPLLVLLPLLAAAMAWVVGESLAPLRRVAAEVQRRDVHSLAPVAAVHLPEEIAPLVDQLNRLLGRVDAALATQRAFIADAAHELRSPLTAVRLQLQLLDRAPDAAARAQARAELGAAVERAIHLVAQLLALARNEPRDVPSEARAAVSLREVAAEALAEMHSLAVARRIELSLEAAPSASAPSASTPSAAVPVAGAVHPAGETVLADREALRILVRNLVDNAVRYTPAGGRVQVSIGSGSGSGGSGAGHAASAGRAAGPWLEVIDTGPGIPPAERARAFDRFHRRASTAEGGCGLGLAIVKAVADRHGASVTLGDAPAGGLRVTVSFASAAAAGSQHPERAARQVAPPGEPVAP